MTALPDDWTPPPRSIESVTPVAPEEGGGYLILCDCATTTHLIIEDVEQLTQPAEMSFCCDGCQSVHWFTVTPPVGEESPA